MNTITRKIQINPIGENSKETWETMRRWNDLIFRAANYISSHAYFQDRSKEFHYFNNDFEKISEAIKEFREMLECSEQNTTYRMVSDKLKGDVPSAMYSALNSVIRQTFDAEKKDYFTGKRSLRSYRKDMPMPITRKALNNFQKVGKDYEFTFAKMRFKTYFGRDLSGNETILERGLSGQYKFCDSSIQIKGKKMFLLATFQFESEPIDLTDEPLFVELSYAAPMIVHYKNKTEKIGTVDEFLHHRISMQGAIKRLQTELTYNKGGKGRKRKLKALERLKEKESNYTKTKVHQYSRRLIDLSLKYRTGRIILVNQPEKEEVAKGEKLILRNWGYHGMKTFIDYKAKMGGIKVEEMTIDFDQRLEDVKKELFKQTVEFA